MKKIVIDTSMLISLSKIGVIEWLTEIEGKIICPEGVYRECVEDGIISGYSDAIIIKRVFDQKIIKKESEKEFHNIAKVDTQVVLLAKDKNAHYVFVDDTELYRKAKLEGFRVMNSPEFLFERVKKEILSRDEYVTYLQNLYYYKRLSKSNLEKYKSLIMEEG
ncbi:MAG: hypothetical protein AB1422_06490 [bacterium]